MDDSVDRVLATGDVGVVSLPSEDKNDSFDVLELVPGNEFLLGDLLIDVSLIRTGSTVGIDPMIS